jgi:hypothetical protein
MPTRGPAAVDAGIGPDRGLDALVAKELFDNFKCARLGVEKDLRAQMPKLVWGEHDTGTPPQIIHNEPRHRHLPLWRPVDIHEHEPEDQFRTASIA